jgi:hypothetical protein
MNHRTNPRDYTPEGKIIPDREDHEWVVRKYGEGCDLASRAHRFRLAQVRKMIRLYGFPAD